MTEKEIDLMKVEIFTAKAGISVATAYSAIRKGKIKCVQERRGLGFVKLVPRSELDKFKGITKK